MTQLEECQPFFQWSVISGLDLQDVNQRTCATDAYANQVLPRGAECSFS